MNEKKKNRRGKKDMPMPIPDLKAYDLQRSSKITLTASALFCLILLWLTPRSLGDLYMALAAGRDIVAHGIGLPDDWSFTTQGRVWINQNWGSHVLFYLVYRLAGEWGLLILKLILITVCVLFLSLSARKKKVPFLFAFFISSFLFALMYHYVDLRPNLVSFGLVSCTLWLIYESRERFWLIWPAALVVAFWVNVHGSAVFGVMMLAAWFLFQVLQAFVQTGRPELHRIWPYGVAVPAAFFVGIWTSPFGWEGYVVTFSLGESKVWRSVQEWLPVWVSAPFGNAVPYVCILLVFLAFMVVKYILQKRLLPGKDAYLTFRHDPLLAEKLFDAVMISVTVIMAVNARRFIPLSVLLFSPLFCSYAWWFVAYVRKDYIMPALNIAAVVIIGALFVQGCLPWYTQSQGRYNPGSLYERMHLIHANYPVRMTSFMNANGLGGNLFCEWRWEGFFRWHYPKVKIFMGGRAQQVYDENAYRTYHLITTGQISPDALSALNINMVALPRNGQFNSLINLLNHDSYHWTLVYNDGSFVLFIQKSTR